MVPARVQLESARTISRCAEGRSALAIGMLDLFAGHAPSVEDDQTVLHDSQQIMACILGLTPLGPEENTIAVKQQSEAAAGGPVSRLSYPDQRSFRVKHMAIGHGHRSERVAAWRGRVGAQKSGSEKATYHEGIPK